MDPLTTLVTALALGAAAGLKSVAQAAVKDGYAALKRLIGQSLPSVDVAQIEKDPGSQGRRTILAEELAQARATEHRELIERAEALIAVIERTAPQAAEVIGVSLEKVRARNVTLRDIISSGSGLVARDVVAHGDFTAEGIRAGTGTSSPGKR